MNIDHFDNKKVGGDEEGIDIFGKSWGLAVPKVEDLYFYGRSDGRPWWMSLEELNHLRGVSAKEASHLFTTSVTRSHVSIGQLRHAF